MPFPLRVLSTLAALLSVTGLLAHEGHDHGPEVDRPAGPPLGAAAWYVSAAAAEAVTGQGDLRFRYRADLSELPPQIAASITRAHGGFAKGPDGEVYFGLKGVGVVRLSADLREKTVIAGGDDFQHGGLHNTTYVERDGGLLVLPDNERGKVYVLKKDGARVGELGRPEVNDYYRDPENPYRPTDTDVGVDGVLYVCDGYSPGKYVLTADLDKRSYLDRWFGGPIDGQGRKPGKFSTNHGVTTDPIDGALLIADRERQWVQRLTTEGEFVEGYDTARGNVCDVDFVDYGGERLMVAGCLVSDGGKSPGFVAILRNGEVVSVLKPKVDLGIEPFQHIHNAAGIVVEGKLFVLCYGWNPGCYAVLEHVGTE